MIVLDNNNHFFVYFKGSNILFRTEDCLRSASIAPTAAVTPATAAAATAHIRVSESACLGMSLRSSEKGEVLLRRVLTLRFVSHAQPARLWKAGFLGAPLLYDNHIILCCNMLCYMKLYCVILYCIILYLIFILFYYLISH